MSKPQTHYDAARGGAMLVGICGHVASGAERLTSDAHKVTCRLCRRRIGRALLESSETFVPSEPYPVTRQQWDARGVTIVKRSIEGDDVVREYVWANVKAAFADWRLAHCSSVVASSSSYGSGGGRADHEPAAMARLVRVLPVERAVSEACSLGRVFAGDESGNGRLELSALDVRFVIELCVAGCGDADVSGRLATRLRLESSAVTEHQVSIIRREAWRSVHESLSTRKLIPRAESRGPAKEKTMAILPGYELEGIKAIADYLGVSEATVKRIIQRPSDQNPLHVARYLGGVYASRTNVEAWRAREARLGAA